jgi:hypothetical protein
MHRARRRDVSEPVIDVAPRERGIHSARDLDIAGEAARVAVVLRA